MIMEMFGLPPSKHVGILKDALKDAILDGIISNTKEAAIIFVTEKAKSMGLEVKKS
jgi:poly(A) polymerase